MKHHERTPLVPIARGKARGSMTTTAIAISMPSALVGQPLRPRNPHINAALKDQLDTLEHAMLAGCTHEPAVLLAERLHALTQHTLGHAFFAFRRASAVEIALKMLPLLAQQRPRRRSASSSASRTAITARPSARSA